LVTSRSAALRSPTLQNLFTLTFVVTRMASMGLSLAVSEILQSLRYVRLVALALAANFVVMRAAAFALSKIIPLDQDVQIGLLLIGIAAGAPFLPKLALIAKANVAFDGGLMTMLMLVTIVYLPLVLPSPPAGCRGQRRSHCGVAYREHAGAAAHRSLHQGQVRK
jgi:predicted Na+-dependent transporter